MYHFIFGPLNCLYNLKFTVVQTKLKRLSNLPRATQLEGRARSGSQIYLTALARPGLPSPLPVPVLNTDTPFLPPKDPDSEGLGWGLRICFSKELPDDADVAGGEATL